MPAPRWIDLQGAANARVVVPGVLLRSDNLQSLSERDVRVLIDGLGLAVVLDLRTETEVALEGPGPLTHEPAVRIEHHSLLPSSGGNTDVEIETVRPWGRLAGDAWREETPAVRAYMSYLDARPDSIVGSIRTIARTPGTVLVHCAAGKDRTGVVVALALEAAGFDRELIADDYLATAERIEPILARLVSSPTYRAELEGHDPAQHTPLPGTIERLFELIDEQLGGTISWLRAHGLGEDDVQLVRRRLVVGAYT